MVNGAGLAMATMDLIKLHGGEPANFLDVGGGATTDRVKMAIDIIMENPNVDAILINIFGGIVRCDVIAQGITEAVKSTADIYIVVRLQGTNVEQDKILEESGMKIISASDLTDLIKVVSSVKEAPMSVLVNQETRILCQGITGSQGSFHAEQCIEYSSNIVAGVTPGKGGSTHLDVPL